MKSLEEREEFFDNQSEKQEGGAVISEWCTLVLESAYSAFISEADIATIITVTTCIEAFLKDDTQDNKSNFASLIDNYGLDEYTRQKLHEIRLFRNRIVHNKILYDEMSEISRNEFHKECERMAFLAIELLFTVFYYYPFV